MKIELLGVALVLALTAAASAKVDNGGIFSAKDLSGVSVNAGGGRIEITGVKGDVVSISPLDPSGVCEFKSKVSGKNLEIEKQLGKNGAISSCAIKMPAQLAVKVDTGAGRISVKNMSGAVEISNTAGETTLSGLTGAVKLNMTTGRASGNMRPSMLTISGTCGNVKFTGLAGGAQVDRTCGVLDLAWVVSPAAEIAVKSGGGPATLSFPSGAKVKTELKTRDSGKIRNDFPGAAGTLVSVTMGGGDINIIKAGNKK